MLGHFVQANSEQCRSRETPAKASLICDFLGMGMNNEHRGVAG
jgi:hypothetical protein